MKRFVATGELSALSGRQTERGKVLSVYCSTGEGFPERVLTRLEEFLERYREFEGREDLQRSIREAEHYLAHSAPKKQGLALFVDATADFFEVYELPRPWKCTVVYGPSPYTRPLEVLLGEYRRIFLVPVDRREARFFEIFMGEIEEHEPFFSDVPSRVRAGGWYGLEERRIARSIEQKVVHHFQDVVDILLEHFRKGRFEVFFVGLREEDYALFERVLPSYLRERLKGRVTLDPKSGLAEISEVALSLERMVLEEEDHVLIDRLLTMVGNAASATIGLANVLRAASFGACQTVVVDESYREEGFLCPSCGTMTLAPSSCELCGGERRRVENIVEEVLEMVVLQRGEVKYVFASNPRLSEIQRIGAFLRFLI